MKTQSRNELIAAILMTVMGILFLVWKTNVISIAMTVFGIFLILQAILSLIAKQYVVAAIKGFFGVIVILLAWVFIKVALIIFAILLALVGLLQLLESIKKLPQAKTVLVKALSFVKPAIYIAISVCLFVNTVKAVDVVFIIAGVFFIVEGIISLINYFATSRDQS